MPNPHGSFKALGPVDWDAIPKEDLPAFLSDIFRDAQYVVDSIPAPVDCPTQKLRKRSATGTSLATLPDRSSKADDGLKQLRKEWKEVKVNPRENPLGLSVYKLAAKDGNGAWFARRSVHEGVTFEKWKLGMQREFGESMKVQGGPGEGKIRGIGADKRVVDQTVDGCGRIEVYQLSAQFPGPSTPRDFVTLFLSSDSEASVPSKAEKGQARQFMVVSKPCNHPECPQRQGYIRGQYESVEFIREIKIEKPLRKTQSSVDLPNGELPGSTRTSSESLGREAVLRSARKATISSNEDGRQRGKTVSSGGAHTDGGEEHDEDEEETMIEWLMVTRSDPGGSVPRFLVERGTPGGIAGDANKFLQWISSRSLEDFEETDTADTELKKEASEAETRAAQQNVPTNKPTVNLSNGSTAQLVPPPAEDNHDSPPGAGGLYDVISGALASAASAAASRIPYPFGGSGKGGDTESDLSSDISDASSMRSFHSFDEDTASPKLADSAEPQSPVNGAGHGRTNSMRSLDSAAGGKPDSVASSTNHDQRKRQEKELHKLEERRRKLDEKLARAQERTRAKRSDDAQREEAALAKLRDRHARELAKQEEKYARELRKLEQRREQEQRKARKRAERAEKATLSAELENARAERDLARREIEILKRTVGELQAQNTALVARLGKQGSGSISGLPDRTSSEKSLSGKVSGVET
ncbi:hypothetical protein F4780DRAFT_551197 [Xylariomycetidae sp. FL0641]|nr:hypothetical protein F4780DRAFT_551197 [Xylariomycetidae sp. FL0641]